MAFKKWWCEKCNSQKGYLSSKAEARELCRNKYTVRVCRDCGEVVKEISK